MPFFCVPTEISLRKGWIAKRLTLLLPRITEAWSCDVTTGPEGEEGGAGPQAGFFIMAKKSVIFILRETHIKVSIKKI
jgi:hypothetical protein